MYSSCKLKFSPTVLSNKRPSSAISSQADLRIRGYDHVPVGNDHWEVRQDQPTRAVEDVRLQRGSLFALTRIWPYDHAT